MLANVQLQKKDFSKNTQQEYNTKQIFFVVFLQFFEQTILGENYEEIFFVFGCGNFELLHFVWRMFPEF